MQERRTTIRYECPRPAQYCSADDLLPRDGRVTDLTDRGVGLLAHEPHQAGERLTVTFTLPGEEEPLTTTGLVRWSGRTPTTKRWFPLGLEWLPLEDTVRFRLDTFLNNRAKERASGPEPGSLQDAVKRWRPSARHWGLLAAAACGLAGSLSAGLLWLGRENNQLSQAIQHRNLAIAQLRQDEARQQQRLTETAAQLAEALQNFLQLQQQSGEFQSELKRLTGETERFQAAYATLYEQREGLIRQIVALEQDRAKMVQRLASIPWFSEPPQAAPGIGDSAARPAEFLEPIP